MPANAFFLDGYNRHAYIAGRTNIHPAFRMEFRPMTVEEHSKAIQDIRNMTLVQEQQHAAKMMAQKIINWNVGEDITEGNLLRLPGVLFHRIWQIVTAADGGDPDPETGRIEKPVDAMGAAKN